MKMLMKGRIVNAISATRSARPAQSSPRGNPHRAPLPAQTLDRDDDHDDQDHEQDSQSRSQANSSLGERKDIDLNPGDGCRVAGPTGRRDIDDVKRGKRGDHRDGQAHADFVLRSGTVIETNSWNQPAPSILADS